MTIVGSPDDEMNRFARSSSSVVVIGTGAGLAHVDDDALIIVVAGDATEDSFLRASFC